MGVINRFKRNVDELEIELTNEERKTIEKTLKQIPINAKRINCKGFLKWQKKQVNAFNNLAKKWNKKKLGEELYDPKFKVQIKSVHKSNVVCSSDKLHLCKFYQEFMDKKLEKISNQS